MTSNISCELCSWVRGENDSLPPHDSSGTHRNDDPAKKKIFWPGTKKDLRKIYNDCPSCQMNKESKQMMEKKFHKETFLKTSCLGNRPTNWLALSRRIRRATRELTRQLNVYGMPYIAKSDSGPAFRETWKTELRKRGVNVTHSSCCNPQSMGFVERSVRTLKKILNKAGNNLSQLQIVEMVYEINSREQ